MPTKQKSGVIPCAICNEAPADPSCGVAASAWGVGNVILYLCRADYERVLRKMLDSQTQISEHQRKQEELTHLLQEAEALEFKIYGDQWPAREVLWELHRQEEKSYEKAREHYREADDATPAGQLARCRVIRWASLCLASAIGIEAIGGGEAISGTLFRVTSAFLKQGLTISRKEITREQVFNALLAILHYREANPESEMEEIQLLSTKFL